MSDVHEMLVIEDDPAVASVLAEVCGAIGCRARPAPTLADVRAAIEVGGFCAVLLDLQIPVEPHGRPLVGAGETALALLRAFDGRRNAEGHHVLPILAITGYSTAPDFIAGLFRAGIDDFIDKSFDDGKGRSFRERLDAVHGRMRAALADAGRADHARCASLAATVDPGVIHLAMGGEVAGRRLVVHVNGQRCEIQGQYFLVLLRLALEHERDPEAWLTRTEIGIGRTPAMPTRIRESLAAALPPGVDLIETRYGGHCRLKTSAVIALDRRALGAHADPRVTRLFAQRARLAKLAKR